MWVSYRPVSSPVAGSYLHPGGFRFMTLDFDVATELLSFRNARAAVAGCADAYREPADIFDNAQDVQARIARSKYSLNPDWVAFFFRGTFNTAGWLRDFDPTTIRFGRGEAHRKTIQSVLSVLPKIRMAIPDKKIPVFISGHSKGAREAQPCAEMLFDLGFNVRGVYTFGTPRGFDFFAAHQYNQKLGHRSWKFIHGSDIVCRVPYPPLWFHCGQEVYLPAGDIFGAVRSADYKVNAGLLYKLACDGRELYKEWRREVPLFADHKIETYVAAVSALP